MRDSSECCEIRKALLTPSALIDDQGLFKLKRDTADGKIRLIKLCAIEIEKRFMADCKGLIVIQNNSRSSLDGDALI